MSSVIKYPDWQPDYLAAVMEADVALMAEKVFRAESAILNRRELLARGDGTDNAAELKAMAEAIKGLQLLRTRMLDHPDWK